MADLLLYYAVPSRGMIVHWMPVMPRHPELLTYWQGLEKRPAWERANEDDKKYMSVR